MQDSDNSQDLDFDAMTEEELEAYIKGNQGTEPEEEENNSDPDEGQPDQANITQDNPETGTSEKKSDNEDDILNDPAYARFANKGKKELIDIIENGTRKISEQGNQIHEFRSRLEAIERVRSAKPELDTELNGYDQNDIQTIRKVAQAEALAILKQAEQERMAMKEAEIKRNREDNDNVWLVAKSLIPEVAQKIESALVQEIKNDADSTINVSGWAKNRIQELLKEQSNQVSSKTKTKVVTKPFNSGVTSGAVLPVTQSGKFNPNKEPDDPEEYRAWLKATKNIVI